MIPKSKSKSPVLTNLITFIPLFLLCHSESPTDKMRSHIDSALVGAVPRGTTSICWAVELYSPDLLLPEPWTMMPKETSHGREANLAVIYDVRRGSLVSIGITAFMALRATS